MVAKDRVSGVTSSQRLLLSEATMGGEMIPSLARVEGKLKGLQLSEAERKVVKIGKNANFMTVGKLQAVEKLLSDRPAKAEHLGKTLAGVWCPFSGLECKDLGKNRFLFSFREEKGKKKAVDNGPWFFNKSLLVVEDFAPNKTIDDYQFKMIPIWVRLYGIPMGMMDRETGALIGEQIGEVLDMDLDDNGFAFGQFMRIKVRMDITVPLMRGITFDDDEDEQNQKDKKMVRGENGKMEEQKKMVSFEYEHLPDFCYNCGIIGHGEKACITRARREGERQYGPWLRATIYKGSSSEEKSRGSSDKGSFWRSNSAGSSGSGQGSDGPSWRKTISTGGDDDREKRDVKEVTSPQKFIQEEQTATTGSKKLIFAVDEHKTQAKAEQNMTEKRAEEKEENLEKTAKEPMRVGSSSSDIEPDYTHLKPDVKKMRGTFKRRERQAEAKTQEMLKSPLKKRGADLMEIDGEHDLAKKVRMEVEKTDGVVGKEAPNKDNLDKEAGLPGQPGREK